MIHIPFVVALWFTCVTVLLVQIFPFDIDVNKPGGCMKINDTISSHKNKWKITNDVDSTNSSACLWHNKIKLSVHENIL